MSVPLGILRFGLLPFLTAYVLGAIVTSNVARAHWNGKHWHEGHGKTTTCNNRPNDPLGECLEVYYNNDTLAPGYITAMADALWDWESKTVGRTWYASEGYMVRIKNEPQGDVMGAWAPTYSDFYHFLYGEIILYDNNVAWRTYTWKRGTVCHEFGHALGLEHFDAQVPASCLNTHNMQDWYYVSGHDVTDSDDVYQY